MGQPTEFTTRFRGKSPDPPDKGNGRDRKQDRSPPRGGNDKKSNQDDGKKPDKGDKPPAEDGDDPKKPSSTGTSKSVNVGTDTKDSVKRVTSSYVSNQLGKYDGTTCLETFLARFDKCVKYMGRDEEDQQFNLSVSLEGAAGQILWDVESCSTVEETIGLLQNRFGNVNQAERFRAELRAKRRRPGESLQQLYQDVSRLMSLAYPGLTSDLSNIVARDAFLEALGDNALRVRILEKEPTDLDSALKIACRLAAYDGGDPWVDYLAMHQQPPGEKSPKKHQQKFNRQVHEKDEHRSGHQCEDMFQQFQEGLKDCLSQMTAYKIEMENLRQSSHAEGNGKQHPSTEKSTFPLSYGDHGGKAPSGGHKGGNGNKSGHGSKSSGQGKSGGQGDWRDRGPCYKCGDVGHWIKNCPLNKKGDKDQSSGQSHDGASQQH